MKQRTPLAELIAKFEDIQINHCKSMREVIFFDGVIAITQSFLPKEKQVIIDAHDKGVFNAKLQQTVLYQNGEEFFNETYKQ